MAGAGSSTPAGGDTAWFVHDRFGMFIHWGLYALPARHEWVQSREQQSAADYDVYRRHFDPDLYDPRAWAQAAAAAGMRYVVVTTKHHDGFCLWDSALTDYTVASTPHGRDLIGPLVEACRAEGLRVGFYHSLLDWHHPEFPIDHFHPLREHPDVLERNRRRDIRKYTQYLHGQVEELLTRYGRIDIMWFDFSYPERWPAKDSRRGKGKDDWQSEALVALVRRLQPNVILNDRLEVGGDVTTPEQYQPRQWVQVDGRRVTWETCQTFSGSWGYHRDESTWKSPEQLVQMLVSTVACGGNLLMNVGPTGRGELDPRAREALAVYARWMRLHERSIRGCTASEHVPPSDCRYTQCGNRLYCHVFAWPFRRLHLDGLAGRVEYAQLLHDASEIPRREPGGASAAGGPTVELEQQALTLELPVQRPDVTVPVIELFLR